MLTKGTLKIIFCYTGSVSTKRIILSSLVRVYKFVSRQNKLGILSPQPHSHWWRKRTVHAHVHVYLLKYMYFINQQNWKVFSRLMICFGEVLFFNCKTQDRWTCLAQHYNHWPRAYDPVYGLSPAAFGTLLWRFSRSQMDGSMFAHWTLNQEGVSTYSHSNWGPSITKEDNRVHGSETVYKTNGSCCKKVNKV